MQMLCGRSLSSYHLICKNQAVQAPQNTKQGWDLLFYWACLARLRVMAVDFPVFHSFPANFIRIQCMSVTGLLHSGLMTALREQRGQSVKNRIFLILLSANQVSQVQPCILCIDKILDTKRISFAPFVRLTIVNCHYFRADDFYKQSVSGSTWVCTTCT